MKNLNEFQVKSLLTGTSLAAELKPSSSRLRCFITLSPYQYDESGKFLEMTKYLKKIDDNEVFFLLRRYEIPDEYIEKGWDVCEHELINFVYLKDIRGFKNLESELLKYMDDLSSLGPEWKCENPL